MLTNVTFTLIKSFNPSSNLSAPWKLYLNQAMVELKPGRLKVQLRRTLSEVTLNDNTPHVVQKLLLVITFMWSNAENQSIPKVYFFLALSIVYGSFNLLVVVVVTPSNGMNGGWNKRKACNKRRNHLKYPRSWNAREAVIPSHLALTPA